MLNLSELQKEILKTTMSLGYKVDKKKTIKKLFKEIFEFKKAKRQMDKSASYKASCIRDDKKFMAYYNLYLKDTIQDEAPDIILVMLSYLEHEGIDSETVIINKIRYNKLRNPK